MSSNQSCASIQRLSQPIPADASDGFAAGWAMADRLLTGAAAHTSQLTGDRLEGYSARMALEITHKVMQCQRASSPKASTA